MGYYSNYGLDDETLLLAYDPYKNLLSLVDKYEAQEMFINKTHEVQDVLETYDEFLMNLYENYSQDGTMSISTFEYENHETKKIVEKFLCIAESLLNYEKENTPSTKQIMAFSYNGAKFNSITNTIEEIDKNEEFEEGCYDIRRYGTSEKWDYKLDKVC